MLAAIRRGDRIVTGGGIIGTVNKVIDDNELLVEIAEGVRVRVHEPLISTVLAKTKPPRLRPRRRTRRAGQRHPGGRATQGFRHEALSRRQERVAEPSPPMSHFPTWKIVLILAVAAFVRWRPRPTWCPGRRPRPCRDWIPHRQIGLGLDLQGGSHLLLDVDTGALIRERLESMVEGVRAALRGARIRYEQLGIAGKAVQVTHPGGRGRARFEEILREARPRNRDRRPRRRRITVGLTEQAIVERETAAVEQALETIRRRIDQFGVSRADHPAPGRGSYRGAAARHQGPRAGHRADRQDRRR